MYVLLYPSVILIREIQYKLNPRIHKLHEIKVEKNIACGKSKIMYK